MQENSITLTKLAKELNLSTRQTERFLQQYYGKNFREKKQEAKMERAALLLEEGSMSVTEISEEAGYTSVQHFSYAFRKYFGISPSGYRAKC